MHQQLASSLKPLRRKGISRARRAAVVVLAVAAMGLGACSSGGGTASSSSPANGVGSSPAGTTSQGAAGPSAGGSGTAPASSAGSAASSQEWAKIVEAAKAEGKVVVGGPAPQPYQDALKAGFESAYPGITVEMTGGSSGTLYPMLRGERDAGLYNWDALVQPSGGLFRRYMRDGMFDPLPPVLLSPGVKDDANWIGGFDFGWQDAAKQFVYSFNGPLTSLVRVNRDAVSKEEFSDPKQLIEPQWRGKFVMPDPRIQGFAGGLVSLLKIYGEDFVVKLLQNDPVLTSDRRQAAEMLVRGRPGVALGVDGGTLGELQAAGVGKNIESVNGVEKRIISDVWGSVSLFNHRPHSNAGIVFVNWILSQQGQEAFMKGGTGNDHSRRTDVAGPAEIAPRPGDVWEDTETTEYIQNKATELANEHLK